VKRSVLDESQFTLGTAATNTSDRFIYDNTTGALFFDVDGTGANQQVQIANLQAGLALNNTDIYIMA
jgi:Ca2+-binding RTX toxin-like protein